MLHILLLILKIIGIILAVILGILILLICIILFVPIRYETSAKCDGTIDSLKAKAKVTWLLHLVRADVFLKGKKIKWKLRIAWMKRTNSAGETKRKEEKSDEAQATEESGSKSQNVEEKTEKDEVNEEPSEVSEKKCEVSSKEIKEDRSEEAAKNTDEKCEDHQKPDKASSKEGEKESIRDKIETFIQKIKDLLAKKEKLTDFLTDKSHVNAFRKAKKELLCLLKHLKPNRTDIKLHFGFEDPCTTGQVLAALSIVYPFLGETTEIVPDFENQILEGNVYIKGKIRICHFAALALKLLLFKDIRTSYKDIRNFKL